MNPTVEKIVIGVAVTILGLWAFGKVSKYLP